MDIHTNTPLKEHTTMRLGGPARFFAEVQSIEELQVLYRNAKGRNLPIFVLGGGSNIIARDEGFQGVVMHIKIPGFTVIAEDEISKTVTIGAGENWDEIVRKTVDMQLSGIEAMSAIPGTVGATPVQNVGAYGQEISDTLLYVEAYDTISDTFVQLDAAACEFSYRDSIFRSREAGRYIITSVTLQLSTTTPAPPFYESLQTYLANNVVTYYTPLAIREAVLAIRHDKLPDPAHTANTGSFFKNVVVEEWRERELRAQYPDLKTYDMGNGMFKVPTGWLIEKAGLKGALLHGMRVYEKNALVLVNESAQGYADLAAARDEIIGKVRDMFQIIIEQEPLEI